MTLQIRLKLIKIGTPNPKQHKTPNLVVYYYYNWKEIRQMPFHKENKQNLFENSHWINSVLNWKEMKEKMEMININIAALQQSQWNKNMHMTYHFLWKNDTDLIPVFVFNLCYFMGPNGQFLIKYWKKEKKKNNFIRSFMAKLLICLLLVLFNFWIFFI